MKKTWRHLRAARGPGLCPGGVEEDFDKDPRVSEVGRPVLREDKEFLQQCVDNCGLALLRGYTAFHNMREREVLATGTRSIRPSLRAREGERAATVWFDIDIEPHCSGSGGSADFGRWMAGTWVDKYGAGSSEPSDQRVNEFKLPRGSLRTAAILEAILRFRRLL